MMRSQPFVFRRVVHEGNLLMLTARGWRANSGRMADEKITDISGPLADFFKEQVAQANRPHSGTRTVLGLEERGPGAVTFGQVEQLFRDTLPKGAAEVLHGFGDPQTPISPDALWSLAELLEKQVANPEPFRESIADLYRLARSALQTKALETGRVHFGLVNAWLNENWLKPRRCPICGDTQWGIAPTFAQIPAATVGLLDARQRSNPCVALISRKCGYTMFFNAIVMGLLPKSEGQTNG